MKPYCGYIESHVATVSITPKRDLVLYCDSLAKKNSEALSFIPRPTLERYADAGQILAAFENGDLCGFLIFGKGWPVLRVYQACIQYDARKRRHGMALIDRLLRIAYESQCSEISLWCANDLSANEFWRECGFVFRGSRAGGARRGRIHNHWQMQISPDLFGMGIEDKMQFDEVRPCTKQHSTNL